MNDFLNQPISWKNQSVRQAVAVGLLVILLLLIFWSFFSLFMERQQEVQHLENILSRYERAIKMEPVLQQRLSHMKKPAKGDNLFLSGENEALAGAALQDNFKAIVEMAHGTVERSQNLGGQAEGNFQKITVRSQLVLSINSLQKILYAMESGKPYIFIENLEIKNASNQKNTQGDLLKVVVDFYGYRHMGARP